MAYFADLTPYAYCSRPEPGTLNVGWLAAGQPFLTGSLPEELLERLWDYLGAPVYLTLGYHVCDYCGEDCGVPVSRGGRRDVLGSAEIRVVAADGTAYAAPDMLYHYVADHGYRPPDCFVEAVLKSPAPPGSPAWLARFGEL